MLDKIIERLERENNVKVKVIIGEEYSILGLVGDISSIDINHIESLDYVLDYVLDVQRGQEPYKRVSRKFKPEDTIVKVGNVEIGGKNPEYFLPQQFNNSANPEKHYETTAKEILDDFGTSLDAFVSGVGTAGTLSGVGKRLREESPNTRLIAVEPADSPVLSGGDPGKHIIQGIGAGFIPKNYNEQYVDEIIKITKDEAVDFGVRAGKEAGLFLGISSGVAIAAAYQVAKKLGRGKKVLAIAPDGGEKYLSLSDYK